MSYVETVQASKRALVDVANRYFSSDKRLSRDDVTFRPWEDAQNGTDFVYSISVVDVELPRHGTVVISVDNRPAALRDNGLDNTEDSYRVRAMYIGDLDIGNSLIEKTFQAGSEGSNAQHAINDNLANVVNDLALQLRRMED